MIRVRQDEEDHRVQYHARSWRAPSARRTEKGLRETRLEGVGSDWDTEGSELTLGNHQKAFLRSVTRQDLHFGKITWDEWGGCRCRGKGVQLRSCCNGLRRRWQWSDSRDGSGDGEERMVLQEVEAAQRPLDIPRPWGRRAKPCDLCPHQVGSRGWGEVVFIPLWRIGTVLVEGPSQRALLRGEESLCSSLLTKAVSLVNKMLSNHLIEK